MSLLGPLTFRPMNEDDAQMVLTWRYDEPYDLYNPNPADLPWMLDPKNQYYSIKTGHDELIGFCTFGDEAQVPGGDYTSNALDIGLGLRPDLTGQGLGLDVVSAILDFARKTFVPSLFRLTVARFNWRAIRVYEKAGFQHVNTFMSETEHRIEFIQMIRPAG